MTTADDLTRDLHDILNGVRSSINYSIENLAEICEDTGSMLGHVEEDLEQTQVEITELIRSLEKLRKACAQSKKELLSAGTRGEETPQRKALEKLERLTTLKGQFEEREGALRIQKDTLQAKRRKLLKVLQQTEETLNNLRLSKELLFSPTSKLEQETDASDFRLAVLTLQFTEQERLRLARELHDGPAQLFAAAVLLMELVEKVLAMGDTERAGKEVGRVKEQMKDSLGDLRAFLWHLNPQALGEGLRNGLIKLTEQINTQGLSSIQVTFDGPDSKIAPVYASNVFRIVQEAVNNAIKNGQAKSIQITVNVRATELTGQVEDNGCGFEVEAEKKRSREKGSFGLSNMEERAKLVGGTCTLESTPGKGSIVSFRIPIGGGMHIEEN